MTRTHRFPYSSVAFTYDPGTFKALAQTKAGISLWSFLTQPHIVHGLVVGARLGAAPVSAIAEDFLAVFTNGDTKLSPREQVELGLAKTHALGGPREFDHLKRMLGHMIRQVLDPLGYVVKSKNSRANDATGIFTTGARYKRR